MCTRQRSHMGDGREQPRERAAGHVRSAACRLPSPADAIAADRCPGVRLAARGRGRPAGPGPAARRVRAQPPALRVLAPRRPSSATAVSSSRRAATCSSAGWPPTPGPSSATRLRRRRAAAVATHERVRNIVASPLAGIDARRPTSSDLVAELDRALCAGAAARRAARPVPVRASTTGAATSPASAPTSLPLSSATARWSRRVRRAAGRRGAARCWRSPTRSSTSARRRSRGLAVADRRARRRVLAPSLERLGRSHAVVDGPPLRGLDRAGRAGRSSPTAAHALVVVAPLGRLDAAQLALLLADTLAGAACGSRRGAASCCPISPDRPAAAAQAAAVGLGVDPRRRGTG